MAALELARPSMAAMLRHAWEPVTRAGADDRVRPHASMAERYPIAWLGQGGSELCSPAMAAMEERARVARGREREAVESEPVRATSLGDSTFG
jgi:hypothetical protein